jgi:penicillin-insensitive murein endopeptidase
MVVALAACSAPRAEVEREPARTLQPAPVPAPPVLVSTRSADVASQLPEPPAVHAPPAELGSDAIEGLFNTNQEALGSISWGRPSRGLLLNAVQMPDGPMWRVVEPSRAWGTEETIGSIMRAIVRVNAEYPLSPALFVGNVSARRGGYLRPHRSHQSGRDADLGFYYAGGPAWYVRGTRDTLDLPRTWALVKTLLEDPNVEAIFVDRSIQRLLSDYAERAGERFDWVEGIFGRGRHAAEKRIFHEWGHLTHLHVRFRSPVAQATAARAEAPIEAMRRAERERVWASIRKRPRAHTG